MVFRVKLKVSEKDLKLDLEANDYSKRKNCFRILVWLHRISYSVYALACVGMLCNTTLVILFFSVRRSGSNKFKFSKRFDFECGPFATYGLNLLPKVVKIYILY